MVEDGIGGIYAARSVDASRGSAVDEAPSDQVPQPGIPSGK